jgi:hypothetical protein
MYLHKQRVDSDGNRCPRQRLNRLPIAPRLLACPAWTLHAVCGVEHHRRAERPHYWQARHVYNQRVVAETGAPLGNQHTRCAKRPQLLHNIAHIPRREELPLFHIHGLARARRRCQEVSLTAQKRGDLQ